MEAVAELTSEDSHSGTESSQETKTEFTVEHAADEVAAIDDVTPLSSLEDSVERLLQRQRSEIMFELRRLQFGDRPVTGQVQRRRTVENLVLRAVGSPNNPSEAAARPVDSVNGLSESSSNGIHRPESVLVEVNALVERRPVSSILQSASFRRSLENSVRGALQTIRSGPGQTRTQHNAAASSSTNSLNSISERGASLDRPSSSLSRRSGNQQPAAQTLVEDAVVDNVRVSGSDQTLDVDAGVTRAEEWIQQHATLPVDQGDVQQTRTIDLLEQMHHEEFISEISDLIHRQLVTSALNGNFRGVLERHITRHVEASGTRDARVEEMLRRLPRSTLHTRNDFFDLGIVPAAQQAAAAAAEDLDNMSVISATAAVALPQAYTQNNAAISREMHSLRSEIQELKSLMRLSFDLQLDIQRSIKQEVSAALAQTLGGASSSLPSTSDAAGRANAASNGQCLICLDKPVDTVLYQCGHLCLCNACAMQLRQNGSHCPVCRAPIRDIMRTYRL